MGMTVSEIVRDQAINSMIRHGFTIEQVMEIIKAVTPQEPQTFKWCTDCREYDQEKHCCHRFSNVIRDTAEEMKQEYIEREVLDKIKADYENRLKADLMAILDEFDLRLYEQYEDTDLIKVEYVRQEIQQKINELKEKK